MHGISELKSKRIINVLDNNLTFFDINGLMDYDMILGALFARLRPKSTSLNIKYITKNKFFLTKLTIQTIVQNLSMR